MHLYTFTKAPNPMRLDLFLKYKGIEIETTEVNISNGEQFSDEFKAINSASTLPSLVLKDGTVLTDTIAICVYLDKVYPDKTLFGSNACHYAEVIGWDHHLYVDGLMPIAEILRNQGEFFKDRAMPGRIKIPQLDALIDRGKMRLAAFWEDLNAHLMNRDYIVGDQLTLADIDAYVLCSFVGWIKQQVPEECTHILRWHNIVSKDLACPPK